MQKTSVLFVCLGNICRSPTAEGVFRQAVLDAGLEDLFESDSAGTGGWHVGEPPDDRAIAIAARHGVDISGLLARKLTQDDFSRFDLILAMDRSNLESIRRLQPQGSRARVALFLAESLGRTGDVPDPYCGSNKDFEAVYRLCAEAAKALCGKLAEQAIRPAT